jgi:hypothetical protein
MYDYPVEWGGRVFTCGVYFWSIDLWVLHLGYFCHAISIGSSMVSCIAVVLQFCQHLVLGGSTRCCSQTTPFPIFTLNVLGALHCFLISHGMGYDLGVRKR